MCDSARYKDWIENCQKIRVTCDYSSYYFEFRQDGELLLYNEHGDLLDLTTRQNELLKLLLKERIKYYDKVAKASKVFRHALHQQILFETYIHDGDAGEMDDTLNHIVSELREKIGEGLIRTVRGTAHTEGSYYLDGRIEPIESFWWEINNTEETYTEEIKRVSSNIEETVEKEELSHLQTESLHNVKSDNQAKINTATVVKKSSAPLVGQHYIHRQEEVLVMEKLNQHKIVYITGMSGSGKSELARYVGGNYKSVSEIMLSEHIEWNIEQIYKQIEIEDGDGEEITDRKKIQMVKNFLSNADKNVLLILHNYNHANSMLIEDLKNKTNNARVLVTSTYNLRDEDFVDEDSIVYLPCDMSQEDFCLSIFEDTIRMSETEKTYAAEIAAMVGYHTMIVSMLARQLKHLKHLGLENSIKLMFESMEDNILDTLSVEEGVKRESKDNKYLQGNTAADVLCSLFSAGILKNDFTDIEKQALTLVYYTDQIDKPEQYTIQLTKTDICEFLGDMREQFTAQKVNVAIENLIDRNILLCGDDGKIAIHDLIRTIIPRFSESILVEDMEFLTHLLRTTLFYRAYRTARNVVYNGMKFKDGEDIAPSGEVLLSLDHWQVLFKHVMVSGKLVTLPEDYVIFTVQNNEGCIWILRDNSTLDEYKLSFSVDMTQRNRYYGGASYVDWEKSIPENCAAHIIRWKTDKDVLEIPNELRGAKVTALEYNAFITANRIKKVILPPSLTSIEGGAFQDCTYLTHVDIPDNVTIIGEQAFSYCTNLEKVTFSKSSKLLLIGERAFRGCKRLKELILPESVTQIGALAFSLCENLIHVNLPTKLTTISDGMFLRCNRMEEIIIPEGVDYIGKYAFAGCEELPEIVFPEGIDIADGAFIGCNKLSTASKERLLTINQNIFMNPNNSL